MSDLVPISHPEPSLTLLTLNRPDKRNALNVELIESLHSAIIAASNDSGRRVLVIDANGPAFCAGLDLREAQDQQLAERSARSLADLYIALCDSPLVTVCAAHGAVMGGGAGLVAGCDLAYASPDFKMSFPEVRRGLAPALVSCVLHRKVSDRDLRELFLLCEAIDAPRAAALGLINRVVPAENLLPTALQAARQTCKGAPGAVAQSKRLLDDLASRPIAAAIEHALAYHFSARHSPEAAEGIAAFLEKRAPKWQP